jgi:hypothetical protein
MNRPSLVVAGVALSFAACSAGSSNPTDGDASASAIDAPIDALDALDAPVDAPVAVDVTTPAIDATPSVDASSTLDAAPAMEPGKDADPPCDPSVYPCGPYGFAVGSIAPNLSLEGRVDTNADGAITSADGISQISFASLRAGAGVRALAVIGSAVWCLPCNQEAGAVVSLAASYKAAGNHVAFLSDLLDGQMVGVPATFQILDNWAAKYKVDYPLAIDPTSLLKPFFPMPAFPMQVVIRTRDMQITWANNGADPMALQAQIDAVLANP